MKGERAEAFSQARIGTIKWKGQSPYRKNHRRKNWFVGVSKAPDIRDVPEFDERDIRYQTLKASGPGGQHVNKTESVVRATQQAVYRQRMAAVHRSPFGRNSHKNRTRRDLHRGCVCCRMAIT